MFTPFTLLLLVLAGTLLWLDGARARELATAVVNELCRRRGYQLLDETVGLMRFGITRTSHGLRIKRLFRFDYSIEGLGRQHGHILLHGATVVQVDLMNREESADEKAAGETMPQQDAQQDAGKVIPFRRRD